MSRSDDELDPAGIAGVCFAACIILVLISMFFQ